MVRKSHSAIQLGVMNNEAHKRISLDYITAKNEETERGDSHTRYFTSGIRKVLITQKTVAGT